MINASYGRTHFLWSLAWAVKTDGPEVDDDDDGSNVGDD